MRLRIFHGGTRSVSRRILGVGAVSCALVASSASVAVAVPSPTLPTPTIASSLLFNQGPLDSPGQVAYDGTNYWVANYANSNVVEINPTTGKLLRTITDNTNFSDPWALAYSNGRLYVGNYGDTTLAIVNAKTGVTITTVPIGKDVYYVLVADGYVWTANYGSNSITRINPTTYATATISYPNIQPVSLAYAAGKIWVGTGIGLLMAIDPASGNIVKTQGTTLNVSGLAYANGKLWVSGTKIFTPGVRPRQRVAHGSVADVGEVVPFNPTTYAAGTPVLVGSNPYALSYDGYDLWASDYDTLRTYALSATTGAILGNAVTGASPYYSVVGPKQLVVSNYEDSTLSEISLASSTSSVFFADGVSKVTPGSASAKQITALAHTLSTGGYTAITVTGYSTKQGTPAQNLALSQQRATAVADALKAALKAAHVTGITIAAHGGGVLSTYKNEALDRRADIVGLR